jgi:hypothetical protein
MGDIHSTQPVLPIVAAFSRYESALAWGLARCEAQFGPVALISPAFEFVETDYYVPTMGPGIRKCFWVFERLMDPGTLAELKLLSNEWEAEYARTHRHAESRPLNLDPGYVTLAKLVLASTKDHTHRIYLSRGIYAETTLFYRHGSWQHHEWTFPDYRRADYQAFFSESRRYLHGRIRGTIRHGTLSDEA